MIKYQNTEIPVFSVPPDWGANVTLSERFGGIVIEALSTAEERLATNPRALYSIQYDTVTMSEQEQGYIRRVIESAAAMPIAVPLWQFKRMITSAPMIGNTFVECDPIQGAIFDLVPNAIVWNNFNYFETFRTFAVGNSSIQFTDAISKQFAPGDFVVPLIVGYFPKNTVPAVTDANSRFPVAFDEQFISEMFATPLQISGTRVARQPAMEYQVVGGEIL